MKVSTFHGGHLGYANLPIFELNQGYPSENVQKINCEDRMNIVQRLRHRIVE